MLSCLSSAVRKQASQLISAASKKHPLIIFTDIGKDTDDALAITYAAAKGLDISEVVITSGQPGMSAAIARNLLNGLGLEKVPVTIGSNKSIKKEKFHNNIYKGDFCKSDSKFEKFDPDKLSPGTAVMIGPMTDALKALEKGKIKDAFIMAQTKDKDKPDDKAYNFRCDMDASEDLFSKRGKISFNIVGKEQAYKVPLKKPDFDKLANTKHPVGVFLKDHAEQSFEHFKKSLPDVYERAYKGTDNMAYCYDPLTIAVIVNPSLVSYSDEKGIKMADSIKGSEAKKEILETILKFLKK